jgi:hypothetical protein
VVQSDDESESSSGEALGPPPVDPGRRSGGALDVTPYGPPDPDSHVLFRAVFAAQ